MKKISFIFFVYTLLLITKVSGQVTIGPEIGVSYLPFDFDFRPLGGSPKTVSSDRLDFVIGLSAQLPLNEKWEMNTRLTYIDRGIFKWNEPNSWSIVYYEIQQKDFNIEFSFLCRLTKRFQLGIGPTITKKFDTYFDPRANTPRSGETYHLNVDGFYYGLNSLLRFEIKRFDINLFYIRKFKNEAFEFSYGPEPIVGKNRFDLTIGMKLFGYKKSK